MSRDRIEYWLDSVDDGYCKRPNKRTKLNDGRATNNPIHSEHFEQIQTKENNYMSRLPTPSLSGSRHSRMPIDHPRNNDNAGPEPDDQKQAPLSDLAVSQTDLTPRPRRSATAAGLDDDGSSLLSLSNPPSVASSKRSRNSSPTKQLRNAELENTGFSRASLRDDKKPTSLHTLAEELRKIGGGFGILPRDLQDHLMVDKTLEFWNFGDNLLPETTRFPDLSTVRQIYKMAKRCFTNNHPESSWNNDVHSRVLDWVLRDGSCKDDLVDYRCCLTAQIAPDYQPLNSRSKMVNYCFCIEPEPNSPQHRAIESLCKQRPGKSINHTDWADLTKYPIAVSIETKGPSIGYETALLQVATWHSAQWRSLRWFKQDRIRSASPYKIEFLPGIIVMQHHWWFVATALTNDGKAQTFERLLLGETESILGIYKLSIALQRLVQWARDQHWPAFQSDVLGL